MSIRSKLIVFSLPLLIGLAHPALASDEAIAEMAALVMGLQHFPSDGAKTALATIIEDPTNSAATKQIATAIANIQHKVSAQDGANLDTIIADESASERARALAKIVKGINHVPSDEDKMVLQKLSSL